MDMSLNDGGAFRRQRYQWRLSHRTIKMPLLESRPAAGGKSGTTGNLLCPVLKHKLKPDHLICRGKAMKVFIVALIFAGLSAAAVSMILNKFQEPGYVAFTTSGARVGDPGHNLIGPS